MLSSLLVLRAPETVNAPRPNPNFFSAAYYGLWPSDPMKSTLVDRRHEHRLPES